MIVHDIEMHEFSAGVEHGVDLITQVRKIGRKY